MKRKLLAVLIAGAFAVPVIGYSADKDADKDTVKSFVKESAMTAKIKAAMARDKDVSAMRIKVESDSTGVVHLSGRAKSQSEADKAVSIARSVEGVTAVKSEIEVVADAKNENADRHDQNADRHDRSAAKSMEQGTDRARTAVKDSMVTAKVKAAMAKDKEVSALHINVDTDNKGHVHLSGKAKSQAEAQKAVSVARNVEGVTAVTSSIQVSN
jgi:hyperosmotically inducible protein